MNKTIILFFLLLNLLNLKGQSNLNGIVTNLNGEPLAFVNILINNNSAEGATTNIDGKFSITSKSSIGLLRFSYVGFETLYLTIEKEAENKFLDVQLKQSSVAMAPIEIVAGENPAHRIIRKTVRKRDRNNPEKMKSYRCQTYNKMLFDLKPDKEGIAEYGIKNEERKAKGKKLSTDSSDKQYKELEKLESSMERQHLFIMESVTDRQFKSPKDIHETVTHNRVSGFSKPSFAALANAIQPFSFYQDHLEILDKDYLNPISPGSTKAYFFNLEDTLFQGQDSIYILSYRPRKGKNFDGLKGLLYIHTSTYAIQNVIAKPANSAFIDLRIEQQYQFVDGQQWFPEALNFELIAKNYPSKYIGISISGRSYIDSVQINPKINKKIFKRDAWSMADDAFFREDSIWQNLRHQPLTQKEKNTYTIVDSIGAKNNFDTFLKVSEALVSGRYPLGNVDFLFHQVLKINEYEYVRLGAGLATNEKLSKYFSLEGYGAYGFGDKAWKYGGALKINLFNEDRLFLMATYKKDLEEPAAMFSSVGQLFSTRFYADRLSKVEEKRIALSTRPFSFFETELALSQSIWQPGFDYALREVDILIDAFNFSELQFNIRYAYGEHTVSFLGSRVAQKTPFPVFIFAYTKGFDNWLDGAYDFHRFSVGVDHSFLIRRFGASTYRLEAAWVNGSLPYSRLFTSNTFSNDSWLEVINHTFQTMKPYEFLSDRIVHLFFRHDFKSLLLRSKKFQPRLALVHNMGIGKLKQTNVHEGIEVKTMEKGYFESGLRIGDLIRIPYFNIAYIGLGAGVYYRYGPYALPEFWDNTAFNLALDFSF